MSRAILLLLILGELTIGAGCLQERRPIVGVAASLRSVMPELAQAYEGATDHRPPAFSFGASGTLAKQVEGGAPISGVVLASDVEIDTLVAKGILEASSRTILAHNTLVLAARRGEPSRTLLEIPQTAQDERIAIGDPRFVPAGGHARDTLETLGIWDAVTRRAIFTRDVTAAVALLRRGEVSRALIYDTDVRRHEELVVTQTIQTAKRPLVIAARATHAQDTSRFFEFLSSPRAAAIFEAHGFQVSARE